jgi:hypothetical protein
MWLPPILDENPPMLTQVNLNSFITYNPISLSAEMNLVEAVMTLAQSGLHH